MTQSSASVARLPADFYRLWGAYTVGQVGGALGTGALPLIAILVVHATDLQVSLMAALAGTASAIIALPLGSFIEFRRKRPTMMVSDLIAFASLATVPAAAWLGLLNYAQLCIVVALQTISGIVFSAANGAYLKALVPPTRRVEANSRFETTFWTVTTVGVPIGGALISLFGTTITVVIDAISFLLSALGIRTIRTPEYPAARPVTEVQWTTEIRSGWIYIFNRPVLHRLFWNAMIFGGSLMLTTPLVALLMLRKLHFAPWQYALAIGIPGLGGLLGSLCTIRLVDRFGQRTVLLSFGTLRTFWMGLLLTAGPSVVGLVTIMSAETLLMFCAGVFNPLFTTYRMNLTADDHMARVGTAWSISAKCFQPAFIALGGFIAGITSIHTAIAFATVTLLASSLLLPWRRSASVPSGIAESSPKKEIETT